MHTSCSQQLHLLTLRFSLHQFSFSLVQFDFCSVCFCFLFFFFFFFTFSFTTTCCSSPKTIHEYNSTSYQTTSYSILPKLILILLPTLSNKTKHLLLILESIQLRYSYSYSPSLPILLHFTIIILSQNSLTSNITVRILPINQ